MYEFQKIVKACGQIFLIPIESIYPNPNQPRVHFDLRELESLSESIAVNGILQPLSVRRDEDGLYRLIAGERRLRAAKMAGLSCVPCIELNAGEECSAIFALLENLQRQDLSFFEEAAGIARLLSEYGMTQEETARHLGKAQSTLSNKLRLLRLPEDIRRQIAEAGLTERHARALLKLDEDDLPEALKFIISKNLNVTQTEHLIDELLLPKKSHKTPKRLFKDVRIFINTINHAIDTMKQSGIRAESKKLETDEYIEYTVRIPKGQT